MNTVRYSFTKTDTGRFTDLQINTTNRREAEASSHTQGKPVCISVYDKGMSEVNGSGGDEGCSPDIGGARRR